MDPNARIASHLQLSQPVEQPLLMLYGDFLIETLRNCASRNLTVPQCRAVEARSARDQRLLKQRYQRSHKSTSSKLVEAVLRVKDIYYATCPELHIHSFREANTSFNNQFCTKRRSSIRDRNLP